MKNQRISKKGVAEVFRSGRSLNAETIGLKFMRTRNGDGGVSVVVPVRVAGKAVLRNAIRRKVSEAIRPLKSQLQAGFLVVVSVRTSDLPSPALLKEELVAVLRKSGILNR